MRIGDIRKPDHQSARRASRAVIGVPDRKRQHGKPRLASARCSGDIVDRAIRTLGELHRELDSPRRQIDHQPIAKCPLQRAHDQHPPLAVYTIVRATQFMEFIGGIADFSTDSGTVRIGEGLFQPIAADDVAALLAQVALAAPLNGTVDIAGPDRAPFTQIVGRYLKSAGDPRKVVTDREARYYGGRVEEQSLVPLGDARIGRVGLDQWLAQANKP
jgi:hypothetical protein